MAFVKNERRLVRFVNVTGVVTLRAKLETNVTDRKRETFLPTVRGRTYIPHIVRELGEKTYPSPHLPDTDARIFT